MDLILKLIGLAFLVFIVVCLVLLSVKRKKSSNNKVLLGLGLLALCLSVVILMFFFVNDLREEKIYGQYDALRNDLKKRFNIEVSIDDARRMSESKANGDDGYYELYIREAGNPNRIYEAFYRVEDGKINIYTEKQDGVYIKIQ